jgi:hypothetical protein
LLRLGISLSRIKKYQKLSKNINNNIFIKIRFFQNFGNLQKISKSIKEILSLGFCKHPQIKLELKFLQNSKPKPDFVVINFKKQISLTQLQLPTGF